MYIQIADCFLHRDSLVSMQLSFKAINIKQHVTQNIDCYCDLTKIIGIIFLIAELASILFLCEKLNVAHI